MIVSAGRYPIAETKKKLKKRGADPDRSAAWFIAEEHSDASAVLLFPDRLCTLPLAGGRPTFDAPLSKISDLRLEENVSGCLLVCTAENERRLVAPLSYSCKDDAFRLVCVFEKLASGQNYERVEPDDNYCPRCGRRYPESDRKFCPSCVDGKRVLSGMMPFFKKYIPQMALTVLLLVAMSALSVISPYLSSGFFYSEVLSQEGGFYGKILFVIALIVTLRLLKVAVEMISQVISSRISAKLCYDMQKTIFRSIEKLSVSYFSARSTGGLMNQVTGDANRIYWAFVDGFPPLVVNVVQFVAVVIILLAINPLLTLLSLLLFPLTLMLIGKTYKKTRMYHAKYYSKERAMSGMLSDLLNGIRVVKSFAGEKREAARFASANGALSETSRRRSVYNATVFPMLSLLVYLGTIVVWGVGGWMAIKGTLGMDYAALLTFSAYITMLYDPMYAVVDLVQGASESITAMSRLLEVMDAKPEVEEPTHPTELGQVRGEVSFKNVKFSYVKNRTVLDGVSFDIPAGANIGIVGHTGAGKSTIANLIIRLYDVDEGEITIDGVNVKDISFEELHKNIAIVSQETYLFVGTLFDNIRYSCPDATASQVIAAAKAAGAHDFISKLPDGYETKVGQGYKELSGGERQRISIARALLRDPKILILDEATAAMDTRTEQMIQRTLDKMSKGRTTITIAHRLSTLKNADHLIVIKDKKVCEQGRPAELMSLDGVYRRLYTLQLQALRDAGIAE